MRLHIYTPGEPTPVSHANPDSKGIVRDLIPLEDGEALYRAGDENPINPDLTLSEAFGDGGHVIKHTCREITARVHYAGRPATIEVHPSSLVATVLAQAIKVLKIDEGTAAELELRQPGEKSALDPAKPIGAYVHGGSCNITLDLAPVVRNQG